MEAQHAWNTDWKDKIGLPVAAGKLGENSIDFCCGAIFNSCCGLVGKRNSLVCQDKKLMLCCCSRNTGGVVFKGLCPK